MKNASNTMIPMVAMSGHPVQASSAKLPAAVKNTDSARSPTATTGANARSPVFLMNLSMVIAQPMLTHDRAAAQTESAPRGGRRE